MDFHCLARKDLQTLCKMNKIPANRTNVAMAEALSSLNIVKGIEKYCKSTESSAAGSSVESPEKNVVTSPKTIGRRKQVTATPVTRRKKRVSPVKTLQRVYNTRLSAKLLKKEKVESEKKECLEALKFNSDCEVVSDCDLGEVLEDKSVPGCDNVGENLSVPEIEQQNMSVLWTNASEDLDLKESSATEMKSVPLQNSDYGFRSLKKPNDKDMVVLEVPFCEKNDDVGVGLIFSEVHAEVIPNEVKVFQKDANKAETPVSERKDAIPNLSPQEKGSLDVGFSYSKNELGRGTSRRGNGENLNAQVTAITDMNDDTGVGLIHSQTDAEVIPIEVFQIEANKPETPINERKDAIPNLSPQEKMSVDVGYSYSRDESKRRASPRGNGENLSARITAVTDMNGSDYMGVDSSYEIEKVRGSLNSKYADRDLDSKHTAAENMKCKQLENNVEGFQILKMPSCNTMVVVDVPLYKKKDDAGIDLCNSETADITKVMLNEVETPTSEMKAAIPILSLQEKGSVDVGFSFLTNEVQSGNSKRGSSDHLDAQFSALTDMIAGDLSSKGKFHLSEIEQLSESPNSKYADKKLDFKDTDDTNLKSEFLTNKGSCNVEADSSVLDIEQQIESLKFKNAIEDVDAKELAAKYLESIVLKMNVDGSKMDAVDVLEEIPCREHMVVVDPLHHKTKDVDDVDFSPREIEITTEVRANEAKFLPKGTENAEVKTPIQRAKVTEKVFSPKENDSFPGPDEVGVHFSFSEGSDDVELHFYVLEADKNMDAAVNFSTESYERESLKEHLNMESCEKVGFGEGVHDLMIQPKSEKVMLECLSSGVDNSVDGENFDNSVKILEDISCNSESGAAYGDVKGLASQEEISCQAIACGPPICSESSERLENSIHNNSDDDTSIDTEFFQHNAYSKQSDSSRKSSEIYSSDGAFKYADKLEMKGSVKATNDFSGRVLSVDEMGDKDSFSDDPESNSKTFDNSSCDTEAESYFLEYAISSKQQNRKRESTASQIFDSSCTREPADQSEMPESFDSSIGYSSEIASSNQLSAKSISKESRLPVASDISSCCSGIKKLSFDASPKASEAKSPCFLKLGGQMCPSSAPPSLQSRRTKIHLREQPLLLADHPFTEKVLSSYMLSSGPCQFANMSNYMPLSKVDSNVLDDKENIEQNDI
ncbi:uncharacterized protein LOC108211718 isoform X2 [Daucus carota subsp. sativus]|uniref:uncharacterized protein LOC108211718 isoform X2 n=1 Tax=Daucus carota subsp. sativus TaxID=79200 RepID=UPI0007F02E55|nr:PREDICTED: uncharacterized protein LOC108211718 isoform X4 [Daucus carota subsp. sativus]